MRDFPKNSEIQRKSGEIGGFLSQTAHCFLLGGALILLHIISFNISKGQDNFTSYLPQCQTFFRLVQI
jgi:hypothetical protein